MKIFTFEDNPNLLGPKKKNEITA